MSAYTWGQLITDELERSGESWDDVVAYTISDKELDMELGDIDYDIAVPLFTVWTTRRVYFPATHDSKCWCISVARNPDGKPTRPIEGD